ncbi:serine hydrolase [Geminocystis sp. CENA526]|uniref:serine hydrolase n=1 Tax=Geminocystis sp. CENA526 TaxID=1355871 RepID=UPI003D6E44D8
MKLSRRNFAQILGITGLATMAYPLPTKSVNNHQNLPDKIINLFSSFPGQKAINILVVKNNLSEEISLNYTMPLFCGSSFKVYILTEFLRQMEIGKASLNDKILIDDNIRTLSSPVFSELSGKTTTSVALEAMMMHSDNTATDALLNYIKVEKVRQLIQEIGLVNTIIPDNTRIFFSYLLGAENGTDLGWKGVSEAIENPINTKRNIINNQQTMVSSPADFVKFYQSALQGQFFQKSETLTLFKRILTLPNILNKFIPEGALGYVKGGSISFNPQYALSLAGGVSYSNNHWAYYSFLLNWNDETGKLETKIGNDFIQAIAQSLEMLS